jgi:hypothetical protein
MTNTLTVIVPAVPVRALSPNASRKQHWGTKARAKAEAQTAAVTGVMRALHEEGQSIPTPPYRVSIRVEWGKGRRQHDDDNIIACCKGMRDTIAHLMDVDDAVWTYTGVTQGRDPEGLGRTIFTIEGSQNAPESPRSDETNE